MLTEGSLENGLGTVQLKALDSHSTSNPKESQCKGFWTEEWRVKRYGRGAAGGRGSQRNLGRHRPVWWNDVFVPLTFSIEGALAFPELHPWGE